MQHQAVFHKEIGVRCPAGKEQAGHDEKGRNMMKTNKMTKLLSLAVLLASLAGCKWDSIKEGTDSHFSTNQQRYLVVREKAAWNFLYRWTTRDPELWRNQDPSVNGTNFDSSYVAAVLFPPNQNGTHVSIASVEFNVPGTNIVVGVSEIPGSMIHTRPYSFAQVQATSPTQNITFQVQMDTHPAEEVTYRDLVLEDFANRIAAYEGTGMEPIPSDVEPRWEFHPRTGQYLVCNYRHGGNTRLERTFLENTPVGPYTAAHALLYCLECGTGWIEAGTDHVWFYQFQPGRYAPTPAEWSIIGEGSSHFETEQNRFLVIRDEVTLDLLYRRANPEETIHQQLPQFDEINFETSVVAAIITHDYGEIVATEVLNHPGETRVSLTQYPMGPQTFAQRFILIEDPEETITFSLNGQVQTGLPVDFNTAIIEDFQNQVIAYGTSGMSPQMSQINPEFSEDGGRICPVCSIPPQPEETLHVMPIALIQFFPCGTVPMPAEFLSSQALLYCSKHGGYWVENSYSVQFLPDEPAETTTWYYYMLPGLYPGNE